jgi:hypothetical protein
VLENIKAAESDLDKKVRRFVKLNKQRIFYSKSAIEKADEAVTVAKKTFEDAYMKRYDMNDKLIDLKFKIEYAIPVLTLFLEKHPYYFNSRNYRELLTYYQAFIEKEQEKGKRRSEEESFYKSGREFW